MRNQLTKYLVFILMMTAGMITVSCIEEGEDAIAGKGTNRFRLASTDNYFVAVIDPDPTTYPLIGVWRDVVSSSSLSEGASVEYELDATIIDDWNTDNGTTFEELPSSLYSLSGSSLSFAAGDFNLNIEFQPDPGDVAWDYSKAYALGLRLKNPSGAYLVSGKEGFVLVSVVVKNPYEAEYRSTGYFQHPSAPREIDRDKYLTTLSPNSNSTEFGDLGFGFGALILVVNPDNTVTLGDPVPFGSYQLYDDPAYNNTYDPVTKTFWIKYEYIGGSGPRTITEKITRK